MPSMLLSDQSTLRHCFWKAKELGICDIKQGLATTIDIRYRNDEGGFRWCFWSMVWGTGLGENRAHSNASWMDYCTFDDTV